MSFIGYIVLTQQPDKSWKDDWDGEVHTDLVEFRETLERARAALTRDYVKAAMVTVLPDDLLKREPPQCGYERPAQGMRCRNPSVARVRLFHHDDTTTDMDLCQPHVEEAAGEYPDNIKELVAY